MYNMIWSKDERKAVISKQWNSYLLLERDYADWRREQNPGRDEGNTRALSSKVEQESAATYKVEEAAADFVAGVRLRLQHLLHHGQEVPVDGENLLDVGEQNLRGRAGTLHLQAKCWLQLHAAFILQQLNKELWN